MGMYNLGLLLQRQAASERGPLPFLQWLEEGRVVSVSLLDFLGVPGPPADNSGGHGASTNLR